MGQKLFFFNLLKNLVINFYWICSIMKIYIICCVPAQIPYLGKFLFLKYGPKCSQSTRLKDFLISIISRTNQWNNLIFTMSLQILTNSHKSKLDQKICGSAWSRNGCGQFVHRTLKLTVSQEWIDEMNWFVAC